MEILSERLILALPPFNLVGVTKIMEKDVLEKYKMNSRAEAVAFLKSLWNEAPQPCPLCNGKLDFLHKKAKKNNSDWKCTGCGERYDAIKLLNLLNEGFGR